MHLAFNATMNGPLNVRFKAFVLLDLFCFLNSHCSTQQDACRLLAYIRTTVSYMDVVGVTVMFLCFQHEKFEMPLQPS